MAFEEVLQLLAKREALEAKRAEVMRLSMLATAEMLASGEVAPGDPELVAVAARGEAHGQTGSPCPCSGRWRSRRTRKRRWRSRWTATDRPYRWCRPRPLAL